MHQEAFLHWSPTPHPDYDDYVATPGGKVWSRKNNWHGRGPWREMKQVTQPSGHKTVNFNLGNGKYRTLTVHCVILETFVRKRQDNEECRRLDGVPEDNRVENITWGSRSENQEDSLRHGMHVGVYNLGVKERAS